jgi:hypothetical protein
VSGKIGADPARRGRPLASEGVASQERNRRQSDNRITKKRHGVTEQPSRPPCTNTPPTYTSFDRHEQLRAVQLSRRRRGGALRFDAGHQSDPSPHDASSSWQHNRPPLHSAAVVLVSVPLIAAPLASSSAPASNGPSHNAARSGRRGGRRQRAAVNLLRRPRQPRCHARCQALAPRPDQPSLVSRVRKVGVPQSRRNHNPRTRRTRQCRRTPLRYAS